MSKNNNALPLINNSLTVKTKKSQNNQYETSNSKQNSK